MDRQVKLMTIALCAAYLLTIGVAIHKAVVVFVDGVRAGIEDGINYAETGERPSVSTIGTYILSLKPKEGYHSFPTEVINQAGTCAVHSASKSPMRAEIAQMTVEVANARELFPGKTLAADICAGLAGLLVLFVMVFIPVQTFHVVRSINKDRFFDPKNIGKLRSIGYALLALYAANIISGFLLYRVAAQVVQVDGYSLKFDWGNTTIVLLGFVVLMFAELLKVATQLKEEQDLVV